MRNNYHHRIAVFTLILCGVMAAGLSQSLHADPGYVSILDYLPQTWPADGTVDIRPAIEKALAQNHQLYFPGSNDNQAPRLYPISAGLEIPAGRQIKFAPNARFWRIPSKGKLITLADAVRLDGVVIDGNKYGHWPAFKNMGKNDAAIVLTTNNVLTDVVVFNTPGIAFFQWSGGHCKLYRCLAENCGYIDVIYGAMFYQGKWDQHSGDGFYINGAYNLIKDCAAYDCSRWAYTTCHVGKGRPAANNTYVDCLGGDIHFITYGFIDVEGAGVNNRFIRCQSPNSHIAVPASPGTQLIQCMAGSIHSYDAENEHTVEMYSGGAGGLRIEGCVITGGGLGNGLTVGGMRGDTLIPGGSRVTITNNRIYKMNPYVSNFSDASFSVHSIDGADTSLVSDNILYEYDDGHTRGPGMRLLNVNDDNNKVVYGQWDLTLQTPQHLRYGRYDHKLITQRNREYAQELLDAARLAYKDKQNETNVAKLYAWAADIALAQDLTIHWLDQQATLYPDAADIGSNAGWAKQPPENANKIAMHTGSLWGLALPGFRGPGWMYLPFQLPPNSNEKQLYLYLAGIDSQARIFVNGQLLGEHNAWNKPSVHRLDPALLNDQGDQLLTLKIWTTAGQCGSYGPIGIILAQQ